MKLALGTANFGKKYSILKKKLTLKEIKVIGEIAKRSKISLVDTSESYGISQKLLGVSKLNKMKIVTKIKFDNKKNIFPDSFIDKKINLILKQVKSKNIYAILFHDYRDILGKTGSQNIKSLNRLKKKKIVKKIGLSIYDPKELKKIWKKWKPDIVQAPFNVFDQRIYKTKWLNKLKRNDVEIHVRSCFLQGILANYDCKNKDYNQFKSWKKLLNNWIDWCNINRVTRVKACMDFVRKFKKIDYLIVGINDKEQLLSIIDIFQQKIKYIPNSFLCNDKRLIEPNNWK